MSGSIRSTNPIAPIKESHVMKRDDSSPAAYVASVERELRELLVAVRELIFQVQPGSEEIIQYGMLGYPGIGNLAAQKNYVSLYVAPTALAEYKKEHPGVDCGKSCLRMKSMNEFDAAGITKLLQSVIAMN